MSESETVVLTLLPSFRSADPRLVPAMLAGTGRGKGRSSLWVVAARAVSVVISGREPKTSCPTLLLALCCLRALLATH